MLKQRILTALVLVPVVIWAMVFAEHDWFAALVIVAFALVAWEWGKLVYPAALVAAVLALLVTAMLIDMIWLQWLPARQTNIMFAAVFLWMMSLPWLFIRNTLSSVAKFVSGVVAISASAFALLALHAESTHGEWILLAFVFVWASDVGGYVAGRLFGRHRLAPAISPAKTWEGVAGSVLLSIAVALLAAYLLNSSWPAWAWAGIAVVLTFGAVVGDLVESLLKRQAGVKDSGHVLPGHGGMLDRLDSILPVAPVFFLCGKLTGLFEIHHFGNWLAG